MAKPSTTYTFATDANFSSGPASGNPTKVIPPSPAQGFVPGNEITPEQHNYLFNVLADWIAWLDAGVATADLDQHLIETDANGTTAIAALILGNTASGERPLTIQTNPAVTSSAVSVTHTAATGYAIVCSAGTNQAALRAVNSSTGVAIEGRNFGTGKGGIFEGGGSSEGVEAFGGPSGGWGGIFYGAGNGGGVRGVRETASTSPALSAEYDGGGGLVRGALWLEPQQDPSNPSDGDIWKVPGITGLGRGKLSWHDLDGGAGGGSAGKQTAWSSRNGMGYRKSVSESDSTNSTTTFASKVSVQIGFNASPGEPDGEYRISYTCQVRLAAGAALTTRALVEVRINGVTKETHEIDFVALGQFKPITGFFYDTLSGGAKTYELRFRSSAAGNGVTISNARIEALGAFE